jgi:glycine cleavage system aminomethyltransferase T
MLTCRDLTRCAVGQCKYMIVTTADGGIVSDPVLLHPDAGVWWMQLADSDAGLYALGVLSQSGLDAEVTYPDVHPVQVQGPLSARTLAKLVGESIFDLGYYHCAHFEIDGMPVVVSRTGWSAVPGFEVNLQDRAGGSALWNALMRAGEEFQIRPIAPNEARRVEAGIFNYGSDMTILDTPFHVSGLERLVEEQPQDYIGKEALERVRRGGVDRKLVGIELTGDPLPGITRMWPAAHDGREVGRVTDAVWSPALERNIGYVWVPIGLAAAGTRLDVESEHGPLRGTTARLPFVDPAKERPARPLERSAG